jgi:hypothetical protein
MDLLGSRLDGEHEERPRPKGTLLNFVNGHLIHLRFGTASIEVEQGQPSTVPNLFAAVSFAWAAIGGRSPTLDRVLASSHVLGGALGRAWDLV